MLMKVSKTAVSAETAEYDLDIDKMRLFVYNDKQYFLIVRQ
jgi:hypothetical protein